MDYLNTWRDLRKKLVEKQTGVIEDDTEFKVPTEKDLRPEVIATPAQMRQVISGYATERPVRPSDVLSSAEIYDTGYGKSKYDTNLSFDEWIQSPVDYRANMQSNAEKFFSGAAKMLPYAATTFLDGTVGVAAGLLWDGVDAVNGGDFKPLASFINNPFSEAMQKVKDWSDEVLPNYRTVEEMEDTDHWWKHMNANFWGDTVVKNLGFMIGAAVSGGMYAKGARALMGKAVNKAYKAAVAAAVDGNEAAEAAFQAVLRGEVADPDKFMKAFRGLGSSYKRASATSQLVGGVAGAIGESRMEALQGAKEYRDEKLARLEEKTNSDRKAIDDELTASDEFYDSATGMLTKEGQAYRNSRLLELRNRYAKERNTIEHEAEKLANFTFGLNMPLLTASNIVQFGKMFSGGFNTQSRILGKIGNYRGTGSVAKGVGYGVRNSVTEGLEELNQKIISEGMKDIASRNLSAFNNMKYDEGSVKSVSQWLSSALESAGNVISDPSSWEEFAVGALTGALGMPTRVGFKNWAGGLIGGIQQGIQERDASRDLAQRMNDRSKEASFKNLWEGEVRHEALDQIKQVALNSRLNGTEDKIKDKDGNPVGAKFVWKTADDAQKISDVMMWAKAGRLNDLKDMVDSVANISDEEVDSLTSEVNPEFASMSIEDKKKWVKERAEDMKKTIDEYSDMYNTLDYMTFGNPDEDAVEEIVFTAMQIKNFEQRYNTLLDDVLNRLRPTLDNIAKETKKDGNPTERAQKAQEVLNSEDGLRTLFGGYAVDAGIPNGQKTSIAEIAARYVDEVQRTDTFERLSNIGAFAKDKQLRDDVRDLQSLVKARQEYYTKLFSPNTSKFGEKHAEQKVKPEEVADNIATKKNTEDENLSVGNLKTIEQMHKGYAAAKDKGLFLRGLSKKANSDKVAYDFVKMYDSFNMFRKNLMNEHPEIVNKNNGTFSRVANIMLDDLFQKSKNTDELIDNLENARTDLASVNNVLNQLVTAGEISEDEAMPAMISHMYDLAERAIKDSATSYKEAYLGTTGRENVGETKPEVKQQTPDSDNDAPAATVTPEAKQKVDDKKETKVEEKKEQEQPAEVQEESLDQPTAKEAENDGYSVNQQDSMPEEQAYRTDAKGSVKLGYYQQSVPEVAISKMKEVRDLMNQRKTASKEEMEIIDQQLYSILLEDFVQYDENGKPVGGAVDFSDTYKWLQDNDAFRYIAQDLNINDDVVFAIMKDVPQYNGRPQIVVAKVTGRNQNGEIEQVQPLTILHSLDKTGEYMNLDELYDAILTDYESSEPSGSLYVFGGLTKPHTSKVFGKRPGLVRYDRKGTGKSIDSITAYDPDAPIVILDDNNQPVVLRGNVDVSRMFMPNIYPWSASHVGRVYYMAKNGNDTYTPILLSKGTITSQGIEQAPDNGFLSKVRDAVEKLDTITDSLTVDNVEKSNTALKTTLKTLNKYINIDGVDFEYYIDEDGIPKLSISWNTKDTKNDRTLVAGDSLLSVIDDLNRPVRISYKDNLLKESKNNLQGIIEDGLLTSNALELRQVGVNFMFDPWDAKAGKFSRILPQDSEQIKEEKSIPNSENMTVARDAELGEDVDYRAVRKPENFEEEQPVVATGQDNLDDFFDADTTAMNTEMQSDYDSLSEATKQTLEAKGISRDEWNSDVSPEVRKKWINC